MDTLGGGSPGLCPGVVGERRALPSVPFDHEKKPVLSPSPHIPTAAQSPQDNG
jgi:hypothetical protein